MELIDNAVSYHYALNEWLTKQTRGGDLRPDYFDGNVEIFK